MTDTPEKDVMFAVNSASFSGAFSENPFVEKDAPVLYEKIKKAFFERMPANLKAILLQTDEDFNTWAKERMSAILELERLFVVGGSIPVFGFTGGWYNDNETHASTIPSAPKMSGYSTLWGDVVKDLTHAKDCLRAIVYMRPEYVAKVKAEVESIPVLKK